MGSTAATVECLPYPNDRPGLHCLAWAVVALVLLMTLGSGLLSGSTSAYRFGEAIVPVMVAGFGMWFFVRRQLAPKVGWWMYPVVILPVVLLLSTMAAGTRDNHRASDDKASLKAAILEYVSRGSPIVIDDASAQCFADGLIDKLGDAKVRSYTDRAASVGGRPILAPADATITSSLLVHCVSNNGLVGYFRKSVDKGLGPTIIGAQRACFNQVITPALTQRVLAAIYEGQSTAGLGEVKNAIRTAAPHCLNPRSSP